MQPVNYPSEFPADSKNMIKIDPNIDTKGYYETEKNFPGGFVKKYNPEKALIYIKDPQDSVTITHEFIHHLQHKDNP
jgi:hypothetical protein